MASEFLENYRMVEPTIRKLYDSSLRLAILDALKDGPMRLADLRRAVDANAPNTSSKAKELENMGIVERKGSDYKLTDWGTILHLTLKEQLDDLSKISSASKYWEEHDMGILPAELQKGIALLEGLQIRDYGFDVSKSEEDFCKMLRSITGPRFWGGSSIYSPIWVKITTELSKKGVDIQLILTEGVLNSIIESMESKDDVKVWDNTSNIQLYSIDFSPALAFTASSQFFATRNRVKKTGSQDLYKAIYGTTGEAISLGFDIFDFYKSKAKPVKLSDYL
jgi:predicted transcriptional regulator